MDCINSILNKLDRKQELFSSYETVTNEIYEAAFEEMEKINLKRISLAEEINLIDNEISDFSKLRNDCELIKKVLKNDCLRSDVNLDLKQVFDKSQQVFSIIKRIQTLEILIMERLTVHKQEIEKKIKKSNNSPKITQYLNATDDKSKKGLIFGSKI